jgi:molybdopterin synthase catalytic subunit
VSHEVETSMFNVALIHKTLDVARIEAAVADPGAGAIVTFIGTTRNSHLGREVLHLEYEAHPTLAQKALQTLAADAARRFSLIKVCVQHRLGRVDIGQASVVIAVSSAHRGAAFDGCRYLIDTLKTSVPIWKKEFYADGSTPQWVGPDGKPVAI